MLFRRKKSGTVTLHLREEQFCAVIKELAADVSVDYRVLTECDNYNLFYRDGEFLGMPTPFGGYLYPFSADPTKKGTPVEKRNFHSARVVCLSKDFTLRVRWGTKTPFVITDKESGKAYKGIARGAFYVRLNPNDAARNADRFYNRCLKQREEDLFDTEALRDFLCDAFVSRVGAKIQEYVENSGRSAESYVGLNAGEILQVSRDIFPGMKDVFAEYGLTLSDATSESAILEDMKLSPLSE